MDMAAPCYDSPICRCGGAGWWFVVRGTAMYSKFRELCRPRKDTQGQDMADGCNVREGVSPHIV
jgi:hypothetical protein